MTQVTIRDQVVEKKALRRPGDRPGSAAGIAADDPSAVPFMTHSELAPVALFRQSTPAFASASKPLPKARATRR